MDTKDKLKEIEQQAMEDIGKTARLLLEAYEASGMENPAVLMAACDFISSETLKWIEKDSKQRMEEMGLGDVDIENTSPEELIELLEEATKDKRVVSKEDNIVEVDFGNKSVH